MTIFPSITVLVSQVDGVTAEINNSIDSFTNKIKSLKKFKSLEDRLHVVKMKLENARTLTTVGRSQAICAELKVMAALKELQVELAELRIGTYTSSKNAVTGKEKYKPSNKKPSESTHTYQEKTLNTLDKQSIKITKNNKNSKSSVKKLQNDFKKAKEIPKTVIAASNILNTNLSQFSAIKDLKNFVNSHNNKEARNEGLTNIGLPKQVERVAVSNENIDNIVMPPVKYLHANGQVHTGVTMHNQAVLLPRLLSNSKNQEVVTSTTSDYKPVPKSRHKNQKYKNDKSKKIQENNTEKFKKSETVLKTIINEAKVSLAQVKISDNNQITPNRNPHVLVTRIDKTKINPRKIKDMWYSRNMRDVSNLNNVRKFMPTATPNSPGLEIKDVEMLDISSTAQKKREVGTLTKSQEINRRSKRIRESFVYSSKTIDSVKTEDPIDMVEDCETIDNIFKEVMASKCVKSKLDVNSISSKTTLHIAEIEETLSLDTVKL